MKIVSLRDAADRLSVSLSTLKRLISAGALRKFQVTENRVGILESELDEYIAKLSGKSAA